MPGHTRHTRATIPWMRTKADSVVRMYREVCKLFAGTFQYNYHIYRMNSLIA